MILAIQFDSSLLGPSIVIGAAQAGLYGLLAVALVLTYRISRTVAFVHGGLAMLGSILLWWLIFDSRNYVGLQPNLPGALAMLVPVAMGTVLGALYGLVVTSRRCAGWPKLTLTVFSLGVFLVFMGTVPLLFYVEFGGFETPPSPFGTGRFSIFDTVVSVHQAATIGVTIVIGTVLAVILRRTRGGLFVRAIADDVEAARWSGVPINRVGTAVYAGAGAIATLAGTLISPILGPGFIEVLFVFLRALTCAVIGGFTSFPLAVGGAVALGVVDSSLRTGLFGTTTGGNRELITIALVLLAVAVVNRLRRGRFEIVDAGGG